MARSRSNPFLSGLVVGLGATVVFAVGSLSLRILAWPGPSRLWGGEPGLRAVVASAPDATVNDSDLEHLRSRRLLMPVDGYDITRLRDNFREPRVGHLHEAIDLLAPRGSPVRAVDGGVIRRLLVDGRGGITVYQTDTEGVYCYYYAHLERYAPFLREGQAVEKGDAIGSVGSTGNAPRSAPHLHFAIFKLTHPARWWDGTPVNPFPLWATLVGR